MLLHLLPEDDPLKCCTWMCGGCETWQLSSSCSTSTRLLHSWTHGSAGHQGRRLHRTISQAAWPRWHFFISFILVPSFFISPSYMPNICQYQLGRAVMQHDFTLIQWHKRYDAICDIIQAYFATLTTSRYDPDMIRIIWTFGLSPFPHPRHVFGSVAGSISCHRRRMFSGGSPANRFVRLPDSPWFIVSAPWPVVETTKMAKLMLRSLDRKDVKTPQKSQEFLEKTLPQIYTSGSFYYILLLGWYLLLGNQSGP